MRKKMYNKGFTIIELMVSMVVMSTLVYASSSASVNLYRDYKFTDYTSRIEYITKYAKIYSIKNSVYTGLCIDNKTLTLVDMKVNASGSTDACSLKSNKNNIVKEIKITEKYITVKPTTGSTPVTNFIFDPRGIASLKNLDNTNNPDINTLCISNNKKATRFIVGLTNTFSQGLTACP